ncbi:MAG: hypothetical protein ACJ72N_27510 [Labedaea sp.]
MAKTEYLAPGIHGPSLRWYTLPGFLALVLRSAWRFWVTGKPLRGRGDNATFLRDATVDHRGGPVEKLTRARWRRVAWRWGVAGVPLALWALLGRWWVVGYLVCALSTGGVLAWRWGRTWWSLREVRRSHIYPAARVLARVTGAKFRRSWALRAIQLGEESTRVYVPDVELTTAMKLRIANAVGARLGMPEPAARWVDTGVERVYVELSPVDPAPKGVALGALMAELEASPLEEPVVGVAAGGRVVRLDFRNDSPHTLGSAGSGAGKSTLYKLIAMQRLSHGAYAIILDFKKWSHLRWAGRLAPGRVLVEDQVPKIHDILCRVMEELLWRKSFDLHQEAELEDLSTVDIYVEEINTLMSMLVDYWREYVAQRKAEARRALREAKLTEDETAIAEAEDMVAAAMGLPATSPAIQSIRYGVNLGREFHVHWHFIGQSMSAKAAGGRDTRESFRTRLLARWDRKTWKMLADGVDYIACPSGAVGLWAHVHGSEVDVVRVPYVPDEVAVQYVQDGRVPARPLFHGDALPAWEQPALERPATIAEAVERIPGAPELPTARKRVQRAELEPVGRRGSADLFDWAELERVLTAS